MRTMRPFLAFLLLAIAPSCGTDSGGGDGAEAFPCTDGVSAFLACGGDPVGEWTFDTVCVSGPALFANTTMMRDCPLVRVDVAMDWAGTASFLAGSLSFRLTGQASDTTLTIPNACLKGVACADAVQEPGYKCTSAGETCVCLQDASGGALPEDKRTYRVEGNELVTTLAGGTEERMEFCVKDGVLALKVFVGEDAPEGQPGSSRVPAILTLVRK